MYDSSWVRGMVTTRSRAGTISKYNAAKPAKPRYIFSSLAKKTLQNGFQLVFLGCTGQFRLGHIQTGLFW